MTHPKKFGPHGFFGVSEGTYIFEENGGFCSVKRGVSCSIRRHGCFQKRGTPKWMVKIIENPIKMDDLGVPPFLETPASRWFFNVWISKLWLVSKVFCNIQLKLTTATAPLVVFSHPVRCHTQTVWHYGITQGSMNILKLQMDFCQDVFFSNTRSLLQR